MNVSNIVDKMSGLMENSTIPANILPPILLKCTSLMRGGLSAYRTTAKIIENNKALNIPVGDNPDGTTNLINAFTYNVVKEVYNAIKNEATIQAAIPANSLLIKAEGGNAGGPIEVVGYNLLDSIATGIMQ